MTAPAVEETRVDVRYDFNRPFLDQSRPCYVPGARIRLRVPFRGPDMFRFRATRFSLAPPHGLIKNSTLIVGRSVPSDVLSRKRESVIAELGRDMDDIEESLGWVVTDLNRWEPDFRATIEAAIQRRRDDIFAMRKTEFMLGVPIERDGVIAETYAVPALTRRSLPRPVPRRSHKPFTPEPSIMKEAFANIVTDIGGVLAMFERLPITHSDAGEDRLPDQILVTLGAIYGAGSAESFSKHGKTDIYLPWEGNAVFLAECKWWKGQSRFAKEALPQLLDRYIVWRDTHTAMILFIKNKDVSSVITKATEAIREYPRYVPKGDPIGRFQTFVLHQDGDEDRRLKLALLTAAIIR